MNDTMEQFAYQIGPEEDDERLDKWMSSAIADLSRSYIQKCIKDNQVLINGKPQKASYRLKVDDEIVFHIPKAMEPAIEAENIPLSILYEDSDLLIVDKPKGMVVHPAPGHYSGTLVNAVMYHCRDNLSGINGVFIKTYAITLKITIATKIKNIFWFCSIPKAAPLFSR